MMAVPSPDRMLGARVAQGVVRPEWIDSNGHMNVAYYVLVFDLGVDALWVDFGMTTQYMEHSAGLTFAVESHITYQQELLEGDPYVVTSTVLAYDKKRIHQFQRLYHAEKMFLAGTVEWMHVHVDLAARRVSPWPDAILDKLAAYAAAQGEQALPAEAGKRIRIARPCFALQPRPHQ